MSSIFACDLGLNRKMLSRNFFCCFDFRFREIFFNQHWWQMRASLILLFGKTKAFFGKDTARKKTAFLHTLFVENERETSKLKWGVTFFYKVEGHMPKLSSFGRGKKFRPKKSLTSLLHAALQLFNSFILHCDGNNSASPTPSPKFILYRNHALCVETCLQKILSVEIFSHCDVLKFH